MKQVQEEKPVNVYEIQQAETLRLLRDLTNRCNHNEERIATQDALIKHQAEQTHNLVKECNGKIEERDETIQKQNEKIKEQNETIIKKNKSIAGQQIRYKDLLQQLTIKDGEFRHLQFKYTAQSQEMKAHSQQMIQMTQLNHRLQEAAKKDQSEIKQAQAEAKQAQSEAKQAQHEAKAEKKKKDEYCNQIVTIRKHHEAFLREMKVNKLWKGSDHQQRGEDVKANHRERANLNNRRGVNVKEKMEYWVFPPAIAFYLTNRFIAQLRQLFALLAKADADRPADVEMPEQKARVPPPTPCWAEA